MSALEIAVSVFASVLGLGGVVYLTQQVLLNRRMRLKFNHVIAKINVQTSDGKEVVDDLTQAQLLIELYASFTLSRYAKDESFKKEVKKALWNLNVDPVGKLRNRLQQSLKAPMPHDVVELYKLAKSLLVKMVQATGRTEISDPGRVRLVDLLSQNTLTYPFRASGLQRIQLAEFGDLYEGKKQIDSIVDEDLKALLLDVANTVREFETSFNHYMQAGTTLSNDIEKKNPTETE